jgi:hypothetical protein
MKANTKGTAPDQMDMYLESIASAVGPDYSKSMSTGTSQEALGNVVEPIEYAGKCFRGIYQSLAMAKVSDPDGLRRTIKAVTSVDKGVQLLMAAEAPTGEQAQASLDAIAASLAVLKAQDPTILAQVEDCLASSLSAEWQEKIVR